MCHGRGRCVGADGQVPSGGHVLEDTDHRLARQDSGSV